MSEAILKPLIPAKAGTQLRAPSLEFYPQYRAWIWVPAFAGMSGEER